MKEIEQERQEKLLSINEMLAIQRAKYPNRPRWLFRLHMVFLISWLVIKHGNLKSIFSFLLILLYKAYTQYKVAFFSLVAFVVYWIAIDLKAGIIAGLAVLIVCLVYMSFKQFREDIEIKN